MPPRRTPLPLWVLVAMALAVALVGVSALLRDGSGPAVAGSAPDPGARTTPRLGASQVVEDDDVGDPFVLPVHGVPGNPAARYVLFWTTDWRSNVPTAVSADLTHWRRVADALPVLPSWATPNRTMTWGPSAQRVQGGWVLYYSTQEAASGHECIGAAFSSSPTGPYVDRAAVPLVCQQNAGGSIDPSVVLEGNGRTSLIWKNDGNAVGGPAAIWQQQLAPDGRSLTGPAVRLLVAGQPWQHGIVEGPAMLAASGGGWWLFFSGGAWQSNTYDTGLAWCASAPGPCSPPSDRPLLASSRTSVSPGGLDTFVDDSGVLWASYSAFPDAPADARAAMAENRVLEIARVVAR